MDMAKNKLLALAGAGLLALKLSTKAGAETPDNGDGENDSNSFSSYLTGPQSVPDDIVTDIAFREFKPGESGTYQFNIDVSIETTDISGGPYYTGLILRKNDGTKLAVQDEMLQETLTTGKTAYRSWHTLSLDTTESVEAGESVRIQLLQSTGKSVTVSPAKHHTGFHVIRVGAAVSDTL